MKKSTILSAATAIAIVATTAGTYAVWDDLSATGSNTFTVSADSTVVSDFALGEFTKSADDATSVTYKSDFTIAVDGTASKMSLEPVVTKKDGTAIDASYYEVVMNDGASPITATGGKYEDVTITASNLYSVEVKVKNTALKGAELKVTVNAVATK